MPPDQVQPAEPGWYPDPLGMAGNRYWDGSRWTDSTTGAGSVGRRGRGRLVVGLGGLALAVSVFLPWVSVTLEGNLDLFQTLHALGNGFGLGWIALLLGAGVALLAFVLDERQAQPIGILVGLFGGMAAVAWALALHSDVLSTEGFSSLSVGPWVAVGGCVAMLVGGLLRSVPAATDPLPSPAAQPIENPPRRTVEVAGVQIDDPGDERPI